MPLAVLARIDRWGVRRLGPAQVGGFGDFAAFAWTWPSSGSRPSRPCRPRASFTSRAALPHPVGLVGQHRSARVGGGTELAEIRPFRTGDRLRRIHWPVSLRTGALHVTTTYADQDAEVRLVSTPSATSVSATSETGPAVQPRRGRRGGRCGGGALPHAPATGSGCRCSAAAGMVEVPAVGGHHQLARVLLGLGRAEPSRGTRG